MPHRHAKPPVLRLTPNGTHRSLSGHPWVFDNEIQPPEGLEPGVEVEISDAHGRFVGKGTFNPASKIAVRIFSHNSSDTLNADFLRRRVAAARALRRPFLPDDEPRRVLFSEGDFLPGVIADLYENVLVVQFLTLGMDRRRDQVLEALEEAYRPSGIFERSDRSTRQKEGLEPRTGVLAGTVPDVIETGTDGVKFRVAPSRGHKTGAYLDQRFTRRRFASFAAGRAVLDAFAYSGLFGLYAGLGGASALTAIECSKEAGGELEANATLNGLEVEVIVESAFDALKRMESEGRRFDLVSLDPPSFARSSSTTGGAVRGYREINLRAMRLLNEGGLLFTSTCSFHTGRESFLSLLAAAARDSGREIQVLELLGASPDHPVRLEIPETDYLKCAVLRVS